MHTGGYDQAAFIPEFYDHVVPYATLYWFVTSAKAQRELGVTFRNGRETISSTIDWLRDKGMLK